MVLRRPPKTGVFGGRFRTISEPNGAELRVVASPLGQSIDPDQARKAIEEFRPKVVTMTHVDTSSGVRVNVAELSRLARERDVLVVVDGVCSIGGEEFHGDAWGVDVALTASQKAIGAPPGLAIVTVGPRARAARDNRRSPFPGYFTDVKNWLLGGLARCVRPVGVSPSATCLSVAVTWSRSAEASRIFVTRVGTR